MIFFPASSASVMTRIWCASAFSKADVRPIRIAINSASNKVTLFVCALSLSITLLSFHTCAMAVADPTALMLPSEITAMLLGDFWTFSNTRLSSDECSKRASSLDETGE